MARTSLPPELLYKVVSFATTEYLDDLIAGPLSIPHTSLTVSQPINATELDALRQELEKHDPALHAPNPLRPLLPSSYQLRSITLKVLSHVLGVGLVVSPDLPRLAANPWTTRIQPTRLAYSNPHLMTLSPFYKRTLDAATASPLLRIYQVVGCAETVLAAPQTYGMETMRRSRETLMHVRQEIVALRYEVERRQDQYAPEKEDWMWCADERVKRCDERSYAICVFTLCLSLLRTNLCAIRRALEMLRTETNPGIAQDPFFMSMAHIYQDNVSTLLADIQDFAKFQGMVYVPKHEARPYLPGHISREDLQSACSLFEKIVATAPHPIYGVRWADCQDAARAVQTGLLHHLRSVSSST
ncbi:hypothetical protein NM688_g1066 [Phlebia brevispora]|uniref:Uncharacterized protein n=1 Tax=Phlebia brevispora TaxID=194682 RepID=A0ACC1TCR0_9APHY|nr:hypothetical protein NM688_g1066 [Phlebia brevispora]